MIWFCIVALSVLLTACDGSEETTMTGTQKCTVTINGQEQPCTAQP
jgi:major membrane immunogen (membrane-anchored lipoprotein)